MSTRLPLYRMLNAPLGGASDSEVLFVFRSHDGLDPGATGLVAINTPWARTVIGTRPNIP